MQYSVGIDIGGTNIKIGLIERKFYEIIIKESIEFKKDKKYSEIFEEIRDVVMSMLIISEIEYTELYSVGVAVPGSINNETGAVIAAHNLNFYNIPVKEEFSRLFPNLKINVINDADGAAVAELKIGRLRGINTGVFITIGTGLGGSIVLGGKLFKGGLNHGVEPGHMILDKNGEKCTCGSTGCLDAICSSEWLRKQGIISLATDKASLIYKNTNGTPKNVNAKIITEAVKENDPTAKAIFNEFLENLSSALASFSNLLDPEIIVIGGGISDAGDILFQPLREMVQKKSYFKYPYKIVPAKFRNEAGMIGAVL